MSTTFRDLPVGVDFQRFREAIRQQLALWVRSRSRGPNGQPARREITLTESNPSLVDAWRLFSVHRPRPAQAYVRVQFDPPSRRPSIRTVTFSADHLQPNPRPVPPPRRQITIRRMRQVTRELGLRSGVGTFAYWFCRRYAHSMPNPSDNPPMVVHPSHISGMPQYGGTVYSVTFSPLEGWFWGEMQDFHDHPPAGINNSHYIGRQRTGLQDCINHWAVYFNPRVGEGAGETRWQFQRREEWGIFRRVMQSHPPEVTVPRDMVGQGIPGLQIDPWSGWEPYFEYSTGHPVPRPPPQHYRCPCCPAMPGASCATGGSPGILEPRRR